MTRAGSRTVTMRGIVWISAAAIGAAVLGGMAHRALSSDARAAISGAEAVERARDQPGDAPTTEPSGRASTKPMTSAAPFRFAAPVAVADDIAEVRFVDGAGRRTSLAEFREKWVLLNLWATWCGPCREEMPALDRLQALLGGSAFEVVALSIDLDGVGVVRDFYAELGIDGLGIYVDENAMAPTLLDAAGIPTTLLLDREGREIGRFIGPAKWDRADVVAAIRQHVEPEPIHDVE